MNDSPERAALEVRGLRLSFHDGRGRRTEVLSDVSFSVMPGETVGIVGESGSGKSMTSLTVMGLLPRNASVDAGVILLGEDDLLHLSETEFRRLRGKRLSMVLQDPMSSLDPSFTIGDQLADAFRLHKGLKGEEITAASVSILRQLRIPSPSQRLRQYPHQLSGGMRQRVCSAIALAGEPGVLIADEPTTALDVTTQAQYLALLRQLQASTGFSLVLITHDLSVVRQMCERIVVMYAGQVVETGALDEILASPRHPYTRALLDAVPSLEPTDRLTTIEGQAPTPTNYPTGCRFAPRCRFARSECEVAPILSARGPDRLARCLGTEDDGWVEFSASREGSEQ